MTTMRAHLLLAFFFGLLVPALLRGQEDATMRLRLAQQLEQSGEYERARGLYEALATQDPTNYVYFDGLRRVYIQLKEYDQAIALVDRQLRRQPDDPVLLTNLGALHYLAGREQTADSLWNVVLKVNPSNSALYRVVGNQLIEFRMYEEAAALYRRAREATGRPELFGEDLAVIYGALQQYESAVNEYVMLVKRNPMQLPLAQSKIAAFATTPEVVQRTFAVVQDAVEEDPDNPSLRMLLASIAMDARQYDVALREVRLVDRLKNAQGAELYSFAQRALQDRAFVAADQAYQEIIDRYPGISLIPYAKLGRIRTAEERLSSADTTALLEADERLVTSRTVIPWPIRESTAEWSTVIAMYEKLAEEYSRSTIAAQSEFRIGMIAFEKLFDLDRAAQAFHQVEGMREGGDLMVYGRLNSARILTAQNRLGEARSAYASLQGVSLVTAREQATFERAELDYFEAKFDTASSVFQLLGADVRNDLSNDALKYLYFIKENTASDPAALAAFARADLLVRQKKYSEALEHFNNIRRSYPTAVLQDMATLRVGELSLAVGRIDSALVVFRSVVDSLVNSIVRDRALVLSAEIYDRLLHDKARAVATYEELLQRFPGSIYAQLSRQRIRVLRGDAL